MKKYCVLPLLPVVVLLFFLFRLEPSNATVVEDTLDSKHEYRKYELLPRHGTTKRTATSIHELPYDSKWTIKSRGLGVGESKKKASNKNDSMGKLMNGEEQGDGILQEKTKEKSMQRDKTYKGDMNSGKKIKGAS